MFNSSTLPAAGMFPRTPWLTARIQHRFHSSPTFHLDVDLDFHAHRTVVFGPSGSGKSSLLRVLAGLLEADGGEIRIGETPVWQRSLGARSSCFVPAEKRRIGMVMQNPAVFPHRSVEGNVAFALRGMDRISQRERVRELLEVVDAAPLAGRSPRELSGGQLQRVAIARTLAAGPSVLLLDEPFAALDAHSRQRISENLLQWSRARDIPMLTVTHNLAEAFSAGDEVVVLAAGKVIAQGTPVEVLAEDRDQLLRELGAVAAN